MMGILILLAGVAGLVLSGLLGSVGINIHRKVMAAGSGGSWLLFWSIAAVVASIMIGAGVAYLSSVRSTPPTADDFMSVMKALFLFGAAPGVGMLAGGAAAFFK